MKVLGLIQSMPRRVLHPNVISCSSVLDVITYSAVISDWKKVDLDVFEAMKQQVAVPEVIAFHERRIKTECKINSTPIVIHMRNIQC